MDVAGDRGHRFKSGDRVWYAGEEPVLLIQTSPRGFPAGAIAVTGVASKIMAGELPSCSVFKATGYGNCSHGLQIFNPAGVGVMSCDAQRPPQVYGRIAA